LNYNELRYFIKALTILLYCGIIKIELSISHKKREAFMKGVCPNRIEEINKRHEKILEMISFKENGCTLSELMKVLNVSKPQIFIDIRQLRKKYNIVSVKEFSENKFEYKYRLISINPEYRIRKEIEKLTDCEEKSELEHEFKNILKDLYKLMHKVSRTLNDQGVEHENKNSVHSDDLVCVDTRI